MLCRPSRFVDARGSKASPERSNLGLPELFGVVMLGQRRWTIRAHPDWHREDATANLDVVGPAEGECHDSVAEQPGFVELIQRGGQLVDECFRRQVDLAGQPCADRLGDSTDDEVPDGFDAVVLMSTQ